MRTKKMIELFSLDYEFLKSIKNEKLRYAYENAVMDADYVRRMLVSDCEQLKRDMENEILRLNDGCLPNSLGIIQATGSKIDVRCAEYAEVIKRIKILKNIIDSE